MTWRGRRLALLSVLTLLLAAASARGDVFQFACARLPFPIVTQSRAIDQLCGINGDQTPSQSWRADPRCGAAATDPAEINGQKALQNSLKNNLCSSGDITTLMQDDFVALQRTVSAQGIKFGHSGFPPNRQEFFPDDRAVLAGLITVHGRAVGEGSLVRFVAYMDNPHYAEPSEGESVNCKCRGTRMNDIHINLVQQPAPKAPPRHDPNHDLLAAERDRALCHAVVAEIIPHYRPTLWEEKQLRPVADRQVPVRIAGQLFFDASHFPCNGEEPHPGESLRRSSLWEIHPVYAIDVCRSATLDACRAEDEMAWIPLDYWWQTAGR